MKFNWLFFFLMAAVAGLLTYIVAGGASCPPANHGFGQLAETPFLIQELELDEEQVREIKRIHAALAADLEDCQVRHCESRSRLGQLLAGDGEEEKIDAMVAEMCRTYRESEQTTIDAIVKVREVLDDKQKERFDGLIAECTGCQCGHDELK